ncbi:hypothetical protein Tco_0138518 [Tanacetum coccineum]
MPPRMRTRSAGWPASELLGGGTGVRVGRGERGRIPREGNDERVEDLNGQGNDQGLGVNGGIEGVNRKCREPNGCTPLLNESLPNNADHYLTMLAQFNDDTRDFVLAEMQKLESKIVESRHGLEPNDLGFKYEIEIASGQLVEIDKDLRVSMEWYSNYKAEIICHEKVVRIPLPDGKVLRVLGERLKEKARFLMGAKTGDKKQEEIVVIRDFPEVFPDDLSGLPPIREIEFRIELIPGATQVAKSLYRLEPTELEELSG